MKKLLSMVAVLLLTVYVLPLLTVGIDGLRRTEQNDAAQPERSPAQTQPVEDRPLQDESKRSSYDAQTQITVYTQGETRTLSLQEYLLRVVAAEMPASFPEEALKAQALAARTYTLYKVKLYEEGMELPEEHRGAQLCSDSTHCKAFCDIESQAETMWGEHAAFYLDRITAAVAATDGMIAVYEGEPIAAVFHAASGNYTEAAADVWGGQVPYLVSVESSGGEASPKFHETVTVSQADFAAAVQEQYPEADLTCEPAFWFRDSHRSRAGGVIDLLVGGVRVSGSFVRQAAGLSSTNFKVEIKEEELVFTTTGYGHGVGMSQYGAKAMAEAGSTFDEIIKHYFTGTELMLKT